ncbi:EAL domain-containing protein (putative c-di-GMP-specific phosphodiesterase class I) [Bradyrhizobium japonicum]
MNDNVRPQIHLRLTETEARQMDDARAALRLTRNELIRLALDDLYRGSRFKEVPAAKMATFKSTPSIAA